MIKKRLFSSIFSISTCFFILSFSIALPIYFRPFYYLHIKPLGLESSGFSTIQIKEAYNAVLDYLTLPNKEFGVGVMHFSESGASHFADCKALFTLNLIVLIISAVIILAFLLLKKRDIIPPLKFGRRSAAFYGAVSAISIPTIIAIPAAINFKAAFDAFHKVFFAGKQNWIFDRTTDEIIKVLPQTFFRNCAILILLSVAIISLTIIILDFKNRDV